MPTLYDLVLWLRNLEDFLAAELDDNIVLGIIVYSDKTFKLVDHEGEVVFDSEEFSDAQQHTFDITDIAHIKLRSIIDVIVNKARTLVDQRIKQETDKL